MLSSMFQASEITSKRPTALAPLLWAMGIFAPLLTSALLFKAPLFLVIVLVSAFGVIVLLFFFSYIYCLIKDPDALRSESFVLKKMAIEKSSLGDSTSGNMIEASAETIKIEERRNNDGE